MADKFLPHEEYEKDKQGRPSFPSRADEIPSVQGDGADLHDKNDLPSLAPDSSLARDARVMAEYERGRQSNDDPPPAEADINKAASDILNQPSGFFPDGDESYTFRMGSGNKPPVDPPASAAPAPDDEPEERAPGAPARQRFVGPVDQVNDNGTLRDGVEPPVSTPASKPTGKPVSAGNPATTPPAAAQPPANAPAQRQQREDDSISSGRQEFIADERREQAKPKTSLKQQHQEPIADEKAAHGKPPEFERLAEDASQATSSQRMDAVGTDDPSHTERVEPKQEPSPGPAKPAYTPTTGKRGDELAFQRGRTKQAKDEELTDDEQSAVDHRANQKQYQDVQFQREQQGQKRQSFDEFQGEQVAGQQQKQSAQAPQQQQGAEPAAGGDMQQKIHAMLVDILGVLGEIRDNTNSLK